MRECISCSTFGEALHDYVGDVWCARCWARSMRNGVPWLRPSAKRGERFGRFAEGVQRLKR